MNSCKQALKIHTYDLNSEKHKNVELSYLKHEENYDKIYIFFLFLAHIH